MSCTILEENILFIKLYCTIYILSAFFTPPLRWMGRADSQRISFVAEGSQWTTTASPSDAALLH